MGLSGVATATGRSVDGAIRVLWVHNTENSGAMFLSDVREGLPEGIAVDEILVPLRPTAGSCRRTIQRIRKAAKSVDVVHAQFGSLVGFLASFASTRPFILSLRGTDLYALPSSGARGQLESKLRQFLTYMACLRADLIVVMSRRMRRDVRRWPFLSGKRIIVLTDPVGTEFISGRPAAALKDSHPLRVFVGSLSATNAVKRTWLVESAVALCKSIGLPVELEVVSGASRSTVKEVLRHSDVVALTSVHEGWPNVVKEGQACGLPFIATDVSDLSEFSTAESLNQIVEPCELDIANAIVDLMARRHFGAWQANVYSEVVGVKHEMMYSYTIGRD